ncbi:hypothetical protein WNY37_12705 [Henriciella sp. AS95]|uniref:type I pantothenate kinase n=1 Tax=Henriciella sp. AS95 TaxID=3135782 RepID=UPI0031709D2C
MAEREGIDEVASRLRALQEERDYLIVGLTGSVAVGKSTLAKAIAETLAPEPGAEIVGTDGFLLPNAILEKRELMMRKGFPETYDREALAAAIRSIRLGQARIPAYDHETYDVNPAKARTLSRPDLLILEGLGFEPPGGPMGERDRPDILIYLDAERRDIETWFLARFMRFWNAAEHDPTSFYAQFRNMTVPQAEAFAMSVWRKINLPNLEEHILPMREHADIVLKKNAKHEVSVVEDRTR